MDSFKLSLSGLHGCRIELMYSEGLGYDCLFDGIKGHLGKIFYTREGMLVVVRFDDIERLFVIKADRIRLL